MAKDESAARLPESDTTVDGQEDEHFTSETTSARSRAFGVTEVLENILLKLPIRDLLFAQGVSKQFQQVILDSITLQRALFFKPTPGTLDGKAVTPTINPLLAKRMPSHRVPLVFTPKDEIGGSQGTPMCLSVNTVDTPRTTVPYQNPSYAPGFEVKVELTHVTIAKVLGEVTDTTSCHAKGSWRRMLATQPPCQVSYSLVAPKQWKEKVNWIFTGVDSIGTWFYDCSYSDAEAATVEDYKKSVDEAWDWHLRRCDS